MATDYIGDYYADNPVGDRFTENTHDFYHPEIARIFRRRSMYYGMVPYNMRELGNLGTTKMVITDVLPAHASFDPLSMRQMWLGAMNIDSRSREITFNRYGAKVALDKYTALVTAWTALGSTYEERVATPQGKNIILQLIRAELGEAVASINDSVIMNTYLSHPYPIYAGSACSPATIEATDLVTWEHAEALHTDLSFLDPIPIYEDPRWPESNGTEVIWLTTPGVVSTLRKSIQNDGTLNSTNPWLSVRAYANGGVNISRYEVGSFLGTRVWASTKNILWNCGEVVFRAETAVAHLAGDGCPDPDTTKVDNVYRMGQKNTSVKNYISLEDADTGAFSDLTVGDIISIHTDVTDDGRADYTDGTKEEHRIVDIDADANKIYLADPLKQDFDAGSYVTYGRPIHATIAVVPGYNGIVAGVVQPPKIMNPPAIDDFLMMNRFSFDQYLGYNLWNPDVYRVILSAGPVTRLGTSVNI